MSFFARMYPVNPLRCGPVTLVRLVTLLLRYFPTKTDGRLKGDPLSFG